jgi:hypothetical protein
LYNNKQSADAAKLLYILPFLPIDSPTTINENIMALRKMDGAAPATKLNPHNTNNIKMGFTIITHFRLPNGTKV